MFGSVRDTSGAVIPGAAVVLISASRGTSVETSTSENGNFTFPNALGDTYTVRVTMDGFKTLERPNVATIASDWQLSSVLTAGSGASYDVTYSYQTAGANVNLTGSPSYAARVRMVGDPGSGCTSNQYGQFDTSAFAGPTYGSLGLESGRNYLNGCPDKTLDFAIARNFRVGGSRTAQFRVDLFNAFNTVVISNRINQLQLTNPTTQVVRNNQYNADGSLNQQRLTPRTAGFGAATAAQDMRAVQIQLRFQF